MKAILELFWVFFKLGLFTFGGGYAMLPHIKEVVIEKKKWLTEDEVLDIIAIAESTPGPIAINMATYIGNKQKGFWGSLFATIGVVLPSLIIIYIISLFFDAFLQNQYVQYAFVGIKCGVAFLILKTGVEMLLKTKKKVFNIILLSLTLVGMILCEIFAVNISSIFFILFGGVLALVIFAISNKKLKGNSKEFCNENKEEEIAESSVNADKEEIKEEEKLQNKNIQKNNKKQKEEVEK
ncbi:MAG: chromate transporter [Clostridia bacterium]|nr:chromate transporter [Clostridia bacterium]